MPKSHRPYPPAFRERIIELVHKGRRPEELARQFDPSAQAIRNWVRQADRDEGRRPVVDYVTQACVAALHRQPAPSLLPSGLAADSTAAAAA